MVDFNKALQKLKDKKEREKYSIPDLSEIKDYNLKCSYPYSSIETCDSIADEILEVEIDDGSEIIIPMCKYHADIWTITMGYRNLARLIGGRNIKYYTKEEWEGLK